MNRGLIAARCKQLGLDSHTLARQATVDPFFLIDPLGLRAAQGLPIGLVEYLSHLLGLGVEELIGSHPPDVEEIGDDLRLEAALGIADTLSREDIAHVFGWTLHRAELTLSVLEARLRVTGTRLYHADGHRYRLGPALSILSAHDQSRIQRRQVSRGKLAVGDANILHLILGGWVEKRSWTAPAAKVIVERLVSTGLLVDSGPVLGGSAEVRFSLRLDERPLLTLPCRFH